MNNSAATDGRIMRLMIGRGAWSLLSAAVNEGQVASGKVASWLSCGPSGRAVKVLLALFVTRRRKNAARVNQLSASVAAS